MRRCLIAMTLLAAGPFASAQLPTRLDGNGEPLPAGAAARLGSAAGKPVKGWGGAVLSADGTKLLAPHSDRPATRFSFRHYTVYDPTTLKPLGEPVLSECDPRSEFGRPAGFSRDGSRVACVSFATLDIYDVATGKRLLSWPKRGVGSVTLSADGKLAAFGNNQEAKAGDTPMVCAVWDIDAKKEVARVTAAQNHFAEVALSPDGKTLLTRGGHLDDRPYADPESPKNFGQAWDVATGKELGRVAGPTSSPTFSPDSKLVAYSDYSKGAAVVFEARTGQRLRALADAAVGVGPVAFSPDGGTVAVLGAKLGRWEAATGKSLGVVARPAGLPAKLQPLGLTYAGPERLIAVGSLGRAAYAWEALSGRLLTAPESGLGTPTLAVGFAAGGKEVVTAAERDVCRWDAATGAARGRLTVGDHPYGRVALSPDGSRGFSVTLAGGEVRDLATDKPVGPAFAFAPSAWASRGHFVSPDGALLAVTTRQDKAVRCRVVEVAKGKAVAEVALPDEAKAVAVRLSADGARLVVACNGPYAANATPVVVGTWDAKTGAKLGELTLPKGGRLNGFALLDATHALVGTGVTGVQVLDLAAGRPERDLPDPERVACEALALSPDGQLVAVLQTARPGGRHVRLYEVATGKVRATLGAGAILYGGDLNADAAAPTLLAFSPDGTKLVTPETETTSLVWDVPAAK